MKKTQLWKDFLAGRYKEVLEKTGKYHLMPDHEDFFDATSVQIGSLVFLGELKEARILFEKASERECPDYFIVHARFYLGIGNVRFSDFKTAASLFAQNMLFAYRKKNLDNLSQFYVHQGAAFFFLSKGHFNRCEAYAQKAYAAAFECRFPYGQILALELLAISHCQLGKIRLGLHEFDKSLELVKIVGNGGIETALRVSKIRYRALYGIDMQNGESEIRQALEELRPQDTYSKADLVLELSRQLILRGKATEAQRVLDETCDLIYKHQNKRQTALFNHRYASVLSLKGENKGAFSLLRMAILHIDPEFDAAIHRQFQGFLQKLSQEENKFEDAINLPDSRIQKRDTNTFHFEVAKGEDPLGDLIDSVSHNGHQKLAELKRLGLLGLIPRALNLSTSSAQIVFGPERGQIILLQNGDVHCVESGITAPMKRLLQLLQGPEHKSKLYLVEHTWGYSYDPVPHDKLLHATIAKLRHQMGPFSSLLEWSHLGYRLSPEVQLLDPFSEVSLPSKAEPQLKKSRQPVHERQLNLRQIRALKLLEKGGVLDVTSYAIKFNICKMTACRDLATLAKSGLAIKVGRARATKYIGEKFT